jgi:hypothetical protein
MLKTFSIAIGGEGLKRFIFSSPLSSVSLSLDSSHQTWRVCKDNLIGCYNRYFEEINPTNPP